MPRVKVNRPGVSGDLGIEIVDLEARMLARATTANPALVAIKGVGAVIGAQLLITVGDNPDRLRTSAPFAALCGTAPIPVNSGRTDRHRLSRGGDRQADAALHRIVKVRMSYDPATRAYCDAHLAKGWTLKAVFRALKRAVAREVFNALAGHCAVPDYSATCPASQEPHPHRCLPPTWACGPLGSENSSSAADPTTNLPTATAPGFKPLDTE